MILKYFCGAKYFRGLKYFWWGFGSNSGKLRQILRSLRALRCWFELRDISFIGVTAISVKKCYSRVDDGFFRNFLDWTPEEESTYALWAVLLKEALLQWSYRLRTVASPALGFLTDWPATDSVRTQFMLQGENNLCSALPSIFVYRWSKLFMKLEQDITISYCFWNGYER